MSAPIVVLPAPEEVAAAAVQLRRGGHACQDGFDLAPPFDVRGRRMICAGTVDSESGARAALLAAARGAGLLIALSAELDQDLRSRFLDDLGRIGPVRHGEHGEHDDPTPAALSTEQRELVERLADGASIPQAAAELFISVRTAERRMSQVRTALGVRTTAAAVVAYRSGRR